MEEYEGEGTGRAEEPERVESPSEKLEGTPPEGSLVPGPENPESQEIKDEKNPNTEVYDVARADVGGIEGREFKTKTEKSSRCGRL